MLYPVFAKFVQYPMITLANSTSSLVYCIDVFRGIPKTHCTQTHVEQATATSATVE